MTPMESNPPQSKIFLIQLRLFNTFFCRLRYNYWIGEMSHCAGAYIAIWNPEFKKINFLYSGLNFFSCCTRNSPELNLTKYTPLFELDHTYI